MRIGPPEDPPEVPAAVGLADPVAPPSARTRLLTEPVALWAVMGAHAVAELSIAIS